MFYNKRVYDILLKNIRKLMALYLTFFFLDHFLHTFSHSEGDAGVTILYLTSLRALYHSQIPNKMVRKPVSDITQTWCESQFCSSSLSVHGLHFPEALCASVSFNVVIQFTHYLLIVSSEPTHVLVIVATSVNKTKPLPSGS